MGIEGGFENRSNGTTEDGVGTNRIITIEGEPISIQNEITFDESDHVDLPKVIKWDRIGLLSFQLLPQRYTFMDHGLPAAVKLYIGTYHYYDLKGKYKTVRLSNVTQNRPCYFTGSGNGFYAHDPEIHGEGNPADRFYVVGVDPAELQHDFRRMLSVEHELGHALLMDTGADADLLKTSISETYAYLPHFSGFKRYAEVLEQRIPEAWAARLKPENIDRKMLGLTIRTNREVDLGVRLFHERYAWAAGLNLMRRWNSPSGFSQPTSPAHYATACLQTYVDFYNEKRFQTGVRKGEWRSYNVEWRIRKKMRQMLIGSSYS